MTRLTLHALAFMALASLGAVGCDDQASTKTSSLPGAIEGTVNWQGPVNGDLQVAVFSSFPPRGEPVAVQRIQNPSFPYHYHVDGLPPGRYYVLAMVDANPDDGDNFSPSRDPGGAFGGYNAPTSLTVSLTEGPVRGDIQLIAPNADSPWVRRGYR